MGEGWGGREGRGGEGCGGRWTEGWARVGKILLGEVRNVWIGVCGTSGGGGEGSLGCELYGVRSLDSLGFAGFSDDDVFSGTAARRVFCNASGVLS